MKNLFLVVLLSFAQTLVFAQTDSTNPNPATNHLVNTVDTSSMAKIYVIRSTGYVASAVNLRIFVNDTRLCKVKNNRYAMFYLPAGTHLFSATSWDQSGTGSKFALKVPVEAGKTYYMTMKIKQKFFGIEITLEEVTYNTAAPMLKKYERNECD